MKNILSAILFCAVIIGYAQVGVNTDNPSRVLDVNGDLRVRTLNKVTIADYPDVLVTDADGNIEKHSAQAIIDAISDLSVETKELYFDNSPDGTKIVPCGRFNFRFSDTTKPQIASFENLSTPATVYYLGQLKFHENRKTVTQNNVVLQKNDDFKTLDDSYSLNSVGEYYLSYPGDNHFYRVVFLGRKMTLSENSYSIICEKF